MYFTEISENWIPEFLSSISELLQKDTKMKGEEKKFNHFSYALILFSHTLSCFTALTKGKQKYHKGAFRTMSCPVPEKWLILLDALPSTPISNEQNCPSGWKSTCMDKRSFYVHTWQTNSLLWNFNNSMFIWLYCIPGIVFQGRKCSIMLF